MRISQHLNPEKVLTIVFVIVVGVFVIFGAKILGRAIGGEPPYNTVDAYYLNEIGRLKLKVQRMDAELDRLYKKEKMQ